MKTNKRRVRLNPDVFIDAAELICSCDLEGGLSQLGLCCLAIDRIVGHTDNAYGAVFCDLIAPTAEEFFSENPSHWNFDNCVPGVPPTNRITNRITRGVAWWCGLGGEPRIYALLFVADYLQRHHGVYYLPVEGSVS